MRTTVSASILILLSLIQAVPGAQHRLQPVAALRGRSALELALRKLDTAGSIMMTTAHPDDENNAMLAYYAHGRGFRTTLVTATHGEGGQNEIGPELFEALAVLRAEELAAAHRFDGAEQYFARAIDFGYSFSIDETFEQWGHEEILGDFVRMIRTIRPDVIVGFVFDGEGGGQHHQASSRVSLEAFRAAADPDRFPEQITRDGLRPWRAAKFYSTEGFGTGGPGAQRAGRAGGEQAPPIMMFRGAERYDPVLGRAYGEIAGEARSMHKCQGMSQILPLPGGDEPFNPGAPRPYRLRDTTLPGGVTRTEEDPFDGIDTSLGALARFAGVEPPAALASGLADITRAVADARSALAAEGSTGAAAPLARGLTSLRALRAGLDGLGLSDVARFEIAHRLALKETQFVDALVAAADLRLDAVADDGLVVRGQRVGVRTVAVARGGVPVEARARVLNGFASADDKGGTVPQDARLTAAHFRRSPAGARYDYDADVPFGLPFRPTPFTATFSLGIAGVDVDVTIPVQHRTEGNIFSGEKRAELHVVPAFAVSASPDVVIVPVGQPGLSRDVQVTVVNHAKGPSRANVRLDVPPGWRTAPAESAVTFAREDEAASVRFTLSPPPDLRVGRATVAARVEGDGGVSDTGYQVVEYPHTTRRHLLRRPDVTINALDVRVKPGLTVGYVMGVGDDVPQALRQIGAAVTFIDSDELAWGDLGRYDAIMTGVRAYERRADLRAHNQRLLDYARAGGTVIVNYNKFEFNEAQYGPFPGKVGRDRVTDEHAEVRLVDPTHPVFTSPNAIGLADWMGWVQERGLYFFDMATADPQYRDLVTFTEPFPFNQGTKAGALVEAKVGQGRWIYVGLGLWRQLPVGTDGAFRLMANLISLGRR